MFSHVWKIIVCVEIIQIYTYARKLQILLRDFSQSNHNSNKIYTVIRSTLDKTFSHLQIYCYLICTEHLQNWFMESFQNFSFLCTYWALTSFIQNILLFCFLFVCVFLLFFIEKKIWLWFCITWRKLLRNMGNTGYITRWKICLNQQYFFQEIHKCLVVVHFPLL